MDIRINDKLKLKKSISNTVFNVENIDTIENQTYVYLYNSTLGKYYNFNKDTLNNLFEKLDKGENYD